MNDREIINYVNLWLVIGDIRNEDKMQENKKVSFRNRNRKLSSKSKKNRNKTRDTFKNNSTLSKMS